MPVDSIPITFAPENTPMAHEVHPMISWLRKRTRGPGLLGFCMLCRHHPEIGSAVTSAPLWDNSKWFQGRITFAVGRTSSSAPGSTFCMEEELARCVIEFPHSRSISSGLAGWSRTWNTHVWKIAEKDVWERGMWIGLCKWAEDEKIIVSYVNVHRKMASEEGFSIQVG